jgi:hypothetical protein
MHGAFVSPTGPYGWSWTCLKGTCGMKIDGLVKSPQRDGTVIRLRRIRCKARASS